MADAVKTTPTKMPSIMDEGTTALLDANIAALGRRLRAVAATIAHEQGSFAGFKGVTYIDIRDSHVAEAVKLFQMILDDHSVVTAG